MPIIGGREEDVKSLDSSQFQLEQQVIHSFKRSRTPAMEKITSNQSYAINNSTDDTYICDLEDAGRMFEKATELAKSGKAPEAVPLFLQALKEFERLQLPELPQIQDEIGYWLETMEANYVERDPDVTTAANDDEEFFSPDREMGPATTVSTATATSTELSSAGKVPAGERVAKSPLMSTSSNVFYDVL